MAGTESPIHAARANAVGPTTARQGDKDNSEKVCFIVMLSKLKVGESQVRNTFARSEGDQSIETAQRIRSSAWANCMSVAWGASPITVAS